MKYFNRFIYLFLILSIGLLNIEFYFFAEGKRMRGMPSIPRYFSDAEIKFREKTGWANRDEKEYISEEDSSVVLRIWPNGMRECRPDINKKTDFNVAVIGCSCTFGEGVRADETMVWRLNERYPNVTFDNWGVCGWGTAQMYERMEYLFNEYGQKYDLVIYNMLDDHKFRTYVPRALGRLSTNGFYLCCPYGNYNFLGFYTIHNFSDLKWYFEDNLLTCDLLKRIYYAYRSNLYETRYKREVCYGKDLDNAKEAYIEIVNRMKDLCDKNKTDFIVCDIQNKGINDKILKNPKFKSEHINIDHPLSSTNAFHVAGNPHFHPNGAVHAYWAEKFSEWFDERYKDRLKR